PGEQQLGDLGEVPPGRRFPAVKNPYQIEPRARPFLRTNRVVTEYAVSDLRYCLMLPCDEHGPDGGERGFDKIGLVALRKAQVERQLKFLREFKHRVLRPQALAVFAGGRSENRARLRQSRVGKPALARREEANQR